MRTDVPLLLAVAVEANMNRRYRKLGASIVPIVIVCVLGACDESPMLAEIPEDTFWSTTDPATEKMDGDKIGELEALLEGSKKLYSFLVIRNGNIVSETYRNGANERTPLHVRSITKHVTGLLAGIALDKGLIDSAGAYVSAYFDEIPAGSGWNEVTLYHLLNMLSGMDWNEVAQLSTYEEHLDDPIPFIFSRDIIHPPGTNYAYSSPGAHLVSHWIQRVSGSTTRDFSHEYLWDPLGVKGYRWERDGQNVVRGGAGLELTARDLAKIGLLYLQRGSWNGRQIISEAWVEETWNHPVRRSDVGGFDRNAWGYRNFWWTTDIQGVRVHYSDGYGGQLLLVAPAYNLIVVTNRYYRVEAQENREAFAEVFGTLLPKVFESIHP